MTSKKKIAIQRIVEDDVEKAVFSALELINAKEIMKEGMVVLLKPNLLHGKPPERAVTTHPSVLRAVIRWVKQFNPKRIVASDSSGGHSPGATAKAMEGSGLMKVCEEEGIEMVPLEKTEREIYKVENPLVLEEFASSTLLKEADLIINLPKIKTHGQTVLTCCVKNMFGTILLRHKTKTHAQYPTFELFSAALVDIYSVSKPQLTVIDGYLCQEGQGPSSGDVVKLDLIITGYDGIGLDRVVCEIIKLDPDKVKTLEKAMEKGIGSANIEDFEIVGEKIEDVQREFKLPSNLTIPGRIKLPKFIRGYLGKLLVKAKVKFDPEKCTCCGTCWKNCPVEAIKPPAEIKKGNVPTWISKKCITCYCCAELCPSEAIEFNVNIIKNLVLSWLGVIFFGGLGLLIVIIVLLIVWG
ncbi:MAG: DUF362 domain-containing protein [Candidatus Hodarchaeota archaeon]